VVVVVVVVTMIMVIMITTMLVQTGYSHDRCRQVNGMRMLSQQHCALLIVAFFIPNGLNVPNCRPLETNQLSANYALTMFDGLHDINKSHNQTFY
jgi:hypothetical protein